MQAPFADPLSGLEPLQGALPLVGREAEMQLLRGVLDVAALNLPVGARAITLTGEPGTGKTRLLAETCAAARERGFRILEGRTYESGNRYPYFPFIEALRPLGRNSSRPRLRAYLGLNEDDVSRGQAEEQQRETESDPAMITLTGAPLVAALATLFPELPRSLSVVLTPEILSSDQQKFRLLDAVATLLENVAREQPLLFCIDNLQWADSASLELILYLTVRLHDSRIVLLGATRPPHRAGIAENRGEQDNTPGLDAGEGAVPEAAQAREAATRALSELVRQRLLLILPLGPLSTEAATQHLHALLPGKLPESAVRVLLARAGGNPFFLEELVRTLTLKRQLALRNGIWSLKRAGAGEQELPESITLAVEQRLHNLNEACRDLLRTASLFGRTFPLNALVRVYGDNEERTMSLIDEAVRASLIAPALPAWHEAGDEDRNDLPPAYTASPRYQFCQGVVQEVLSAAVPPLRRRALHTAIGYALEGAYDDGSADEMLGKAAHAAELARHFVLGGEQTAALRWSLLAGEEAAGKQAHREAIGHFRRVLSLLAAGVSLAEEQDMPSPAQLHTAIGESWFKLGELEQAAGAFQQALQTEAPVSSLQLAQANRLLADVYRMQGRYDQALAHLQAAQNALDLYTEFEAGREETVNNVPWLAGRTFAGASGNVLIRERAAAAERILFLQARAPLLSLLNRPGQAKERMRPS